MTMGFPITALMDEEACYATLVAWLHPSGLACRRCHEADRMMAHRRHRAPILDFRCGHCGRVFNAATGTILLRPSRGVNQKYLHQCMAPFEWAPT